MAILWADGFDDWTSTTGEYGTISGTLAPSAGNGRRSGAALLINNNGDYIQRALDSALTELFVSFAFRPTNTTAADVLSLFSATTAQITVRVLADGSIEVRRGTSTGTVLGTSAAGLVGSGAFTHFQVRAVISDTVGVVQIRLNGSSSPAINLTSQDTNNGAAAVSVNNVRIGTSSTGSKVGYYDDLVIWDTTGSIANTWIGDTRVDSYFPNANGDSSQFVGSDGNSTDNYLLVDAAAPNGTDYVQSSTVGDKDLYGFGNMSHTPSSIYGVVVTASALKDDAGSRSIRLLAKSSSSEANSGADIALSTSRTRAIGVFETNPATSAAWTKSGVDGAQFGITVAA